MNVILQVVMNLGLSLTNSLAGAPKGLYIFVRFKKVIRV